MGVCVYYRGDWKCFELLFEKHEELPKNLGEKRLSGMFYAWFGNCKYFRQKLLESYDYLQLALKLGEEIGDQCVIGYACTWLAFSCGDLGRLDEGIRYGKRAIEISKCFPLDHYLYFKSISGMAWCYSFKGDGKKGIECGQACIEYGIQYGNVRSRCMGHGMMAWANLNCGDIGLAIENFQQAVHVAIDPFYKVCFRSGLAFGYALKGEYSYAEDTLPGIFEQCVALGDEYLKTACQSTIALVTIGKGEMSKGLRLMEEVTQLYMEQRRPWYYVFSECLLGNVYLQIVQGEGDLGPSIIFKNLGFLIKNVPFASGKAVAHFNKAIAVAEEICAIGLLGQSHLGLGRLHKAKKRKDKAKESLLKAIDCFEHCKAETILKQTREELISLG